MAIRIHLSLPSVLTSRKSTVMVERLDDCRNLMQTRNDDLQDHLRTIDSKLESIVLRTVVKANSNTDEIQLTKSERLSTQQCLEICLQLSSHINTI
ncbi:hypothetical protein F5Y03DRAFT_79124 [Xylaria venustula]|nr:hypothetical protein F5Y03DRAFT_79124 [Xylaria venustula]